MLGADTATVDFAFLFSSLPAAGSTLVFARPYSPSPQQYSLLNASMALGKLIGFPLLFVSAAIFQTTEIHDIIDAEHIIARTCQGVTAVLLLALLASMGWYQPWHHPPLKTIGMLVFFTFGYLLLLIASDCF